MAVNVHDAEASDRRFLERMFVDASWRGRSIGTTLLEALIDRARAHGFSALSLSVAATNPARRLYERQGFVKIGEARSAWTMLARLSDGGAVGGWPP